MHTEPGIADVLLERDAELEAIGRTLARGAGGEGGLLVVDAPAGGGKSVLLRAARPMAAERGLRVLHARGAELEREFGFGVVRQLLEPLLRDPDVDQADLLAGAARLAGAILAFDPEAEAPGTSSDPFAVRHSIYWLVANAASLRPVAVVVDDAHWADLASLGALVHVAHRLEGMPVALVVAMRTEEHGEALDVLRTRAEEAGTLVRPAPLSPEATTAVVRARLPTADAALCRECHRASGGNPFLLLELTRSGLAEGVRHIDRSPERVTREVQARLGRLPETAARLAAAAAMLGDGSPLRRAAALAGIDTVAAGEAADALVAAGILRSAEPIEFLHPLVGSAVSAGMAPAARSAEHARAARLLADEGAPPERVAAQLIRSRPSGDPWACERLVDAARLASSRGAPEAAAAYLRRALEEPPSAGRAAVLLDLGAAESRASDPEAAIARLREALDGDLTQEERFRATMLLAGTLGLLWRVGAAVDVLGDLVAALPDGALRATAEAAITNVARIDPDSRPRGAATMTRLRQGVEAGDALPEVLGTVAADMAMSGEDHLRTAAVAERALAGFRTFDVSAESWSSVNAIRALIHAERFETARRVLDGAISASQDEGGVLTVGSGLIFRAELRLTLGDLAGAEVDARTLREISTTCAWPMGRVFAAAWLGGVLVLRGELEEAAAVLEEVGDGRTAADTRGFLGVAEILLARGRLRVAQGRDEEAVAALRECGLRATELRVLNPSVVPWRSELALALLHAGAAQEARRLAAEELALARGSGAPRAIAAALIAVGRVEGGQEGMRRLREAIRVLADSPAQLERGRAHAALGDAMREAGSPDGAREHLRAAVDLFHRCGARRLEDAAFDDLRETGARPRRRLATGVGSLTPSERRIAELAAAGRQNREIAQELFVTTNTVEFHLRNAYRKLGISGRPGLTDALR